MKKKLIVLSGFVMGLAPVVALAQGFGSGTLNTTITPAGACAAAKGTIEGILCRVNNILNVVIPLLITLAVIYFIWGVISYVIGGDEEAKKAGRSKIIYGIIGLAVIVAVWGLVAILTDTFLKDTKGVITIPCIVGTPGC